MVHAIHSVLFDYLLLRIFQKDLEKEFDGNFIQIWDFSLVGGGQQVPAMDGMALLRHQSKEKAAAEKLSHMLSTACFGIFIGFPASTFVKISNSFCSSV